MSESTEILTMRAMSWEKAKGELMACLQTYWPQYDLMGNEIDNGFKEADRRIKIFIKDFEDNCR